MELKPTRLDGIYFIEPRHLQDERGSFIKSFHKDTFEKHGLATDFHETYYSTSKQGVIRGMHFQTPPAHHAKLVYVTRGSILDVIVDIRKGSPTYGEYVTQELSADNHMAVYIPVGFAHGFLSLEDDTSVTYLQTSMHSPENDAGIHALSFGFDWGVKDPIMSARDQGFPTLADYNSPFSL